MGIHWTSIEKSSERRTLKKERIALDEESIEREYLETALRRSHLLTINDTKAANKEFDKLHHLLNKYVRLLPDRGEKVLKSIAQNSNLDVRIEAAAALLAVDESYAIELLEAIASDPGLHGFTASMTLMEWKKGSLRNYLT